VDEVQVIEIYSELFQKTWYKMVSIVGIHTVTVLVQRSLWITRQKYAEAELIRITEEGLSFTNLQQFDAVLVKKMLEDFFAALIEIMVRLVGKEMTEKITEGIDMFLAEKR